MIEAWWTNLPAHPADINPKSVYANKTSQSQAEVLLKGGCTPDDVRRFVLQQTGATGFYHDKSLRFNKVAADLPAWKKAQKRTYAHPSHKPIDPDEHITAADEAQILANMPPEAKAAFEKMMKAWTS